MRVLLAATPRRLTMLLRVLALLSTVVVLATACSDEPGGQPSATPSASASAAVSATASEGRSEEAVSEAATPTAAASGSSACLATSTAGIDDHAVNAAAYSGLQSAEADLGVQVSHVESRSDDDHGTSIATLIEQDCDLIVAVGPAMAAATRAAAEADPDRAFAIVGVGDDPPLDNLRSLTFAPEEAAFLAGYLAAGVSESGVVATFGASTDPSVTIVMDGFAAGVAHFNSTQGGALELLGYDPTAPEAATVASDAAAGGAAADQLLADGADVVFPVAGLAGLGAAESVSAEGGGARLIWFGSDGCVAAAEYCDVIITSVVQRVDVAVATAVEDMVGGEFDGGVHHGSLSNGGVGLAPYHEFDDQLPPGLIGAIEELEAGIIAGTISVTGDGD